METIKFLEDDNYHYFPNIMPYLNQVMTEEDWIKVTGGLDFAECDEFLGKKDGYAVHISQLEIFDRPKELWAFEKYGSYTRKDVKCKNKDRGMCNYARSLDGLRYVGCEKARLNKAPKNFIYIKVIERNKLYNYYYIEGENYEN